MAKRNQRHRATCPFELYMDILGGKWKGMIVFRLRSEGKRFSELKKTLLDISNRMLALALRELEEDKIVMREVKAAVPPEVTYSLTEIGQKLIPVFADISAWGTLYQQYLQATTVESARA